MLVDSQLTVCKYREVDENRALKTNINPFNVLPSSTHSTFPLPNAEYTSTKYTGDVEPYLILRCREDVVALLEIRKNISVKRRDANKQLSKRKWWKDVFKNLENYLKVKECVGKKEVLKVVSDVAYKCFYPVRPWVGKGVLMTGCAEARKQVECTWMSWEITEG